MANTHSRTELMEFLDYAKSKGLLNAATAESRKAAVNQVLAILDEDEAKDVSALDIDHVLDRFQTLHGKRYSPGSLRTYRARVRNSIDDFLRYQANPMDFRPRTPVASKATKPLLKISQGGKKKGDSELVAAVHRPAQAPTFGTATLPIPLRHDLTVLIHGLPFDLSEAEARKIANVVQAMASPATPQE